MHQTTEIRHGTKVIPVLHHIQSKFKKMDDVDGKRNISMCGT